MQVINKYVSIDNRKDENLAELYIYGDIEDNKIFDEDVTPKEVKKALDSFENVKTIDLHINSGGGSCFAGNAIFNVLDSYRSKHGVTINTYIDGIAASMASGIACVGDKVYAAQNSLLMYHKPLMMAMGNADDFAKNIEILQRTEAALCKNYMRKFKGTEDELKELLKNETWLSADEAKEYGFVDEILEPIELAASAKGITFGSQTFSGKTADMIKNKYKGKIDEKEKNALVYNEALLDYGINEEMFNSLNMESDSILKIIDAVKDSFKQEPVKQFVDKEKVLNILNCKDITEDELLDFALAGMNAPDVTDIQNKANEFEKIVNKAREDAMACAKRAKGEAFNESRTKKMLDALDYEEIVEQMNEWSAEAKNVLHAGTRVSTPESDIENSKPINVDDYKI